MPDESTSLSPGGQFRLPDLGEGLIEAEIIDWHVSAGDRIVADQPLLAVETDKAIVEIPAPHGGRIAQLNVRVGETIHVGEVLLTFFSDEATPSVEPAATVAGELPQAPPPEAFQHESHRQIKASPRTRRHARELDVDLSKVTPTGSNGVIELADVDAAAGSASGERLGRVRRAMAQRMAHAHAQVARASVTDEANISTWSQTSRPTPRLIRAIGIACKAQPLLNARFDGATLRLTRQDEVNLGIAMETADGLFVPVLRDINSLALEEISAELERLSANVSQRTIGPGQLHGQTITLSNFGATGGIHAEMVVVPPQVAIVGAGRLFKRLVLLDESPVENRFLPLSITFDHRVATGVEACEFLVALINDLELRT